MIATQSAGQHLGVHWGRFIRAESDLSVQFQSPSRLFLSLISQFPPAVLASEHLRSFSFASKLQQDTPTSGRQGHVFFKVKVCTRKKSHLLSILLICKERLATI